MGVVSINEDKGKDTNFCCRVESGCLGPGGSINYAGALKGDVGPEFIEEVSLGGEAAVRFADAWGPEDDYAHEALAGDKVEGVVEGLEDDLLVLADQVHWGLTRKDEDKIVSDVITLVTPEEGQG